MTAERRQSSKSDNNSDQNKDVGEADSASYASERHGNEAPHTNIPTGEDSRKSNPGETTRRPCKLRDVPKTSEDSITELESKVNRMERELQAQRFHFKRLKDKSSKSQIENNHLKQELEQLLVDNRLYQWYKNRYEYIVENFVLPYAHENNLQYDDRTRKTLNFVLSPLLQDARDCGTLRNQMQILQQELLMREERVSTVSDEQFAQDFRSLAGQIKTLSRLLRPREEIDAVKTIAPCMLAEGVASHFWSTGVGRKLFIESWIWSTLIQMVFRNPFAVFGTESNAIADLWSNMYAKQHCHEWPCPSLPCETWRYTTMEQLVMVVDAAVITRGETKDHRSYLEQCVARARANIMEFMGTNLALIASPVASSDICRIANEAFALAMRMSLQRSRLQVTFPKIGDRMNLSEMRYLPADTEENTEDGVVALIINPGLAKWGDVHGKTFHHRYDIVPALVQLQPSNNYSYT